MELLKNLNCIVIDNTSDSYKTTVSTALEQRDSVQLLLKQLYSSSIDEIHYDEDHCYIYALFKGNNKLPKIVFVMYLDT